MQGNLEGNIVKYNLLKVFSKRVYLPLIAIYLTTVGHVTLPQLGIIASVTGIVSLILEIPTGYIADKWGHKSALVFGNVLSTIAPLFYILMPNFWGGLIGSVLYFAGGSFSSGTLQAFMHETLLALGREKEYARVMGRAQSYGLLGNVALVSLVPLTYQINHQLPFVIGFLCLMAALIIVASLAKPPTQIPVKENYKDAFRGLKASLSKDALLKLLLVFVIFGISSAAFDASIIYREIIFKSISIPVFYYGFILGISSLLAAIVGRYIHHLKKLSPARFYLFDIVYICAAFVLVGITKSPLVIIIAFTLFPMYDRTRNIIFESQLFEKFSGNKYKATAVSIMNFFPLMGNIGMPILLALLVSRLNLLTGYLSFGIILGLILLPILLIHNSIKIKRSV